MLCPHLDCLSRVILVCLCLCFPLNLTRSALCRMRSTDILSTLCPNHGSRRWINLSSRVVSIETHQGEAALFFEYDQQKPLRTMVLRPDETCPSSDIRYYSPQQPTVEPHVHPIHYGHLYCRQHHHHQTPTSPSPHQPQQHHHHY